MISHREFFLILFHCVCSRTSAIRGELAGVAVIYILYILALLYLVSYTLVSRILLILLKSEWFGLQCWAGWKWHAVYMMVLLGKEIIQQGLVYSRKRVASKDQPVLLYYCGKWLWNGKLSEIYFLLFILSSIGELVLHFWPNIHFWPFWFKNSSKVFCYWNAIIFHQRDFSTAHSCNTT